MSFQFKNIVWGERITAYSKKIISNRNRLNYRKPSGHELFNGLLRYIILSIVILSQQLSVYSQSNVQSLTEPIRLFASPFINGTISNLNSGWMQKSPEVKMLGANFEFSVIGMGTFFPESDRHFSANSNVKLNDKSLDLMLAFVPEYLKASAKEQLKDHIFNVTVSGPTIVGGSNESVKIYFPGDTVRINYQGQYYDVQLSPVTEDTRISGSAFPVVPLAAVQIGIGTIAGTKLMFRFLPPIGGFGDVYYIGGGLQHNPMVWFTKKPLIGTSLNVMLYKLRVGDLFNSFGAQWGASLSKSFGSKLVNVTPFIGLGFEYNKTFIEYVYRYTDDAGNQKSETVFVDFSRETNMRFNTGLEFKAAALNISLNYSYLKYHSISAGIGVVF